MKQSSASLRRAMPIVLALLACVAFAAPAPAQTRNFFCGHGRAVTIVVNNQRSITVSPIDGAAMTLRQQGRNPFHFVRDDYGVTISPDQNTATVDIPDFGVSTCRYRAGRSTAGLQGLGHADRCGPGFHQVPETDACASNAGTPPQTRISQRGLPMPGASLGGVVRAEPTTSSAKIASLREGTPVMIMGREQVWEGYNWFLIRIPQGGKAYQWGGIMCSQEPLDGILARCRH